MRDDNHEENKFLKNHLNIIVFCRAVKAAPIFFAFFHFCRWIVCWLEKSRKTSTALCVGCFFPSFSPLNSLFSVLFCWDISAIFFRLHNIVKTFWFLFISSVSGEVTAYKQAKTFESHQFDWEKTAKRGGFEWMAADVQKLARRFGIPLAAVALGGGIALASFYHGQC